MPGAPLLYELRTVFDTYHLKTEILAASLRSVRHVHEALMAGSHVATLPVSLFESAMQHPLTDLGIEKFNKDWSRVDIKQFP